MQRSFACLSPPAGTDGTLCRVWPRHRNRSARQGRMVPSVTAAVRRGCTFSNAYPPRCRTGPGVQQRWMHAEGGSRVPGARCRVCARSCVHQACHFIAFSLALCFATEQNNTAGPGAWVVRQRCSACRRHRYHCRHSIVMCARWLGCALIGLLTVSLRRARHSLLSTQLLPESPAERAPSGSTAGSASSPQGVIGGCAFWPAAAGPGV